MTSEQQRSSKFIAGLVVIATVVISAWIVFLQTTQM
jgi:hypothetical protein